MFTGGASALEPVPSHVFPVPGPHGERGMVGDFGVPRNGGRTHEGFDITAKCGAKIVAAAGGVVVDRGFHARLYGNFVRVRVPEEKRTYRYSHLIRPAEVGLREDVEIGQWIGSVGDTGNARGTGCHLHFEIRVGDNKPIDPEPALRKWDRYS